MKNTLNMKDCKYEVMVNKKQSVENKLQIENKIENQKKPEKKVQFKSQFKNKSQNAFNVKQKSKQSNNKRKNRKNKKKPAPLPKGVIKIQSTFNNTIISISNLKGNVVGWTSAGSCGFKGAKKSTAFAAKTTAKLAARKSIDKGLKRAKVMVKGAGVGRDNALRGLAEAGLDIAFIRDVTSIPHNGCRPRKKRRV